MANKIIHDLTAVSAVAAADELEVQKSGETTTKRATLTQLTAVEAAARAAQDDIIEASLGLTTAGALSQLSSSWYLRDSDLSAGFEDRSGDHAAVSRTMVNFIRMLDAAIYSIASASDTAISVATFRSPTAASGTFHTFGFYEAPASHKAFSQAAATQTLGTANNPYGARVFIVAGGAGTASGGTTGTAKITITGTSITSAGVRAAGDSEILVADVTALALNQYVESTKTWIGQVTLTIAATGNHTTFALNANYGYAAPHVFNDQDVIINTFVATGRGGATDTGFNIELLKHDGTGWAYSAAAFKPGGTVICALATDYVTEKNLASNVRFKYKRQGLATTVTGASGDGVVVRITTSANNAIESSDFRLYFSYV